MQARPAAPDADDGLDIGNKRDHHLFGMLQRRDVGLVEVEHLANLQFRGLVYNIPIQVIGLLQNHLQWGQQGARMVMREQRGLCVRVPPASRWQPAWSGDSGVIGCGCQLARIVAPHNVCSHLLTFFSL